MAGLDPEAADRAADMARADDADANFVRRLRARAARRLASGEHERAAGKEHGTAGAINGAFALTCVLFGHAKPPGVRAQRTLSNLARQCKPA